MRLKDRVAIITGAGNGMGAADAVLFAKEGAKVVINDIRQENADTVAKQIQDAGGEAFVSTADVTKPEDVEKMVTETVDKWGKVDILVSNAGWDQLMPFLHTTNDFWDKIFNLNLIGHMNVIKAVLPGMAKNKYGKIVTIGSDAGRTGNPMEAPYSAAKGGVIAFTKTLADELAPYHVLVNALAPGRTDTPMSRAGVSEDELRKRSSQSPLLGGYTPVEEIVGLVRYLISPATKSVTGQVFFLKTP